MRTFVALELPESVRTGIVQLAEALRNDLQAAQWHRQVRWTPVANLHVTVRFLGEISRAQVDAVVASLPETVARHPRLHLSVGALGCFPSHRSPRVIWLGLDGDLEKLGHLQADIERCLHRVGFEPERRAFTPHLTIGRVRPRAPKSALQTIGACLNTTGQKMEGDGTGADRKKRDRLSFQVDELIFMRSVLSPQGSVYTPIERFRLG